MFNCQARGCQRECASSDQYFRHIERMHDPLDGYMCFRKCGRVLTSIKSLRKHVLSCRENDDMELPKENINLIEEINVKSEAINVAENIQNSTLCRQNLNKAENQQPVSKTAELLDISTSDLSLKMTLKWLSQDGLPRKVAFDINKDVKANVIDPLSSAINEFQTAGSMSEECKQMLDTLLGNYNCTSEYKCIQELKSRGLYENPSFFTIHEELQPCSDEQFLEQVNILNYTTYQNVLSNPNKKLLINSKRKFKAIQNCYNV